jgi:CheY-like chemotaxis protein
MTVRGEEMSIEVLLVEDSPGDVRLTKEAFRDANKRIHLHVASDGIEAMAFLRQEGIHENSPRPDFILLDLNLPKMDGREVLGIIKNDAGLKTIPTIILTTSSAEEDIVKSYQLQANCYLSEPVELNEFESVVRSINDFWLNTATLPRHKESLCAAAQSRLCSSSKITLATPALSGRCSERKAHKRSN